MSLSDIVGHSGLAIYAEVALVIFFVVFLGIVIYVFLRRNKARYDQARMMPLDDDQPQEPRPPHEHRRASEESAHQGVIR